MAGEGAGQPRWCYRCHAGSRELSGCMVWTCCMRWPCWAPCLVPALGTGAETPVGTTPQRCLPGSSQVLVRVQGQRRLLPRELPGITQRGRVCDEVMNSVVGTWVSRGWGHVRRLKPQIELRQSFIIPLPLTAPTSTKQSLYLGAS